MKKKIILIGGGGHAQSCIEIINQHKEFKLIGFFDKNKNIKKIFSFNNLYLKNKDINFFKNKINFLILGIGFIKNSKQREKIYQELVDNNFKFENLISKNSTLSKFAKIGKANQIFNNVIVNAGSVIEDNVILNNNCLIDHNCKVGQNTHISTGAILNGDVVIGNNTFIGSGSIINQGIKVGKNCIIGSGSIIKKNIPDNCMYKDRKMVKKI